VTGPEWLLNGPGERTPGERARDIKIVARLRHYGVRRDYFHACVALAALTMVVEHLEEGRSVEASEWLGRAVDALENIDRPMPCRASCATLADLLAECTDETKRAAFALTKKRFPAWRPKALPELLEVLAVVCLEELMLMNAGQWVSQGGER